MRAERGRGRGRGRGGSSSASAAAVVIPASAIGPAGISRGRGARGRSSMSQRNSVALLPPSLSIVLFTLLSCSCLLLCFDLAARLCCLFVYLFPLAGRGGQGGRVKAKTEKPDSSSASLSASSAAANRATSDEMVRPLFSPLLASCFCFMLASPSVTVCVTVFPSLFSQDVVYDTSSSSLPSFPYPPITLPFVQARTTSVQSQQQEEEQEEQKKVKKEDKLDNDEDHEDEEITGENLTSSATVVLEFAKTR